MSAVVEDSAPASEVSSATELNVRGMTCQNCVRHVREAILSVPGVSTASVKLEQQSASVRWAEQAEPNVDAVVRAVNEAGYEAELVESRKSKAESRKSKVESRKSKVESRKSKVESRKSKVED